MKTTKTHIYFFSARDIYSNFYPVKFKHRGIDFHSSEQAVMYRKAILFGSIGIANKILAAKTPKEAKALGRSREIAFNSDIWDEHKMQTYKEVLIDKFSLPALKEQIVAAGDRIFVEASPYDSIWGCGLKETDPRIHYKENWPGLNLLGQVLKSVQQELIQSTLDKLKEEE